MSNRSIKAIKNHEKKSYNFFLGVLISVSTSSNNVKVCNMVDVNTDNYMVSMGNGDLMNAEGGSLQIK